MELFICHQTKVGNFVSNSTGSPGGGANRVCLYRLNYFQIRSPAKSALFQPLQFSSFGLVFVSSISVPTFSSVCVACRNMVAILCCARNTKSVCNQPNTQAFQKFVRISSRKHDEYFSTGVSPTAIFIEEKALGTRLRAKWSAREENAWVLGWAIMKIIPWRSTLIRIQENNYAQIIYF